MDDVPKIAKPDAIEQAKERVRLYTAQADSFAREVAKATDDSNRAHWKRKLAGARKNAAYNRALLATVPEQIH